MQVLMHLVTYSLQLPKRNLLLMSSGQALDDFASFTAKHLESCDDGGRQVLSAGAYRLGKRLRLFLTDRSKEALSRMTFLLYRNIGIDMEGQLPGKVIVRKCHFCRYYSPRICRIASLMDAGVICGLFGGGSLVFTERITEGKTNCMCELCKESESK